MGAALKSELLAPGMRVGLYGGSFDPVHEAHLHVARTALKRLALDRVWWLVSPGNPLKAHAPAALAERCAAISERLPDPRQVVSTLEARRGTRATIDLVRHLQTTHPKVRFIWIMGADGLASFHRWKAWTEIADRLPICVIARPGVGMKARLGLAAQHMRGGRIAEAQAKILCTSKTPGWTYLTEPLHPHASRHLRDARPVT